MRASSRRDTHSVVDRVGGVAALEGEALLLQHGQGDGDPARGQRGRAGQPVDRRDAQQLQVAADHPGRGRVVAVEGQPRRRWRDSVVHHSSSPAGRMARARPRGAQLFPERPPSVPGRDGDQ